MEPPTFPKSFEEKMEKELPKKDEEKVDPDLPVPDITPTSQCAFQIYLARQNFWLKFSAYSFALCFVIFFGVFFYKQKNVPDYFEPCFYNDMMTLNGVMYLHEEVVMWQKKVSAINTLLTITPISPELQIPLTLEQEASETNATKIRTNYLQHRSQWKLCYEKNLNYDLAFPRALYKASQHIYAVTLISMAVSAFYFYLKSSCPKLTDEQREAYSQLYSSVLKYGIGSLLSLIIILSISTLDTYDLGFDLFLPPV